jgi:hypothetical protein
MSITSTLLQHYFNMKKECENLQQIVIALVGFMALMYIQNLRSL